MKWNVSLQCCSDVVENSTTNHKSLRAYKMYFQNSREKSKVLKRSSRFFLFTTLHDWTSHISHPSSTEELHTISSEHNNQSYSHQKVFLTASSESCHYDYAWKIKSQGIKSDLQKSEVDFFPLPLPRAPAGREGSFVIDNNKVLSILSKCIQHIIPLQYSISCNPLFILSKQILLSQYTRAVERVAIHIEMAIVTWNQLNSW